MSKLISSKKLVGRKAVSAGKGKRIGKVRCCVFHPSEKRCVGLMVKRPDAALMFHRKDLFVALDGFALEDGVVTVSGDSKATDRAAAKALGVDLDHCVIWSGMPVLAQAGEALGYIGSVIFDMQTGAVHSIVVESGLADNAILGTRSIPANLVMGFKRGMGEALAALGEHEGEGRDGLAESGAILVSDKAVELPLHGGAAEAAGKASAIAADKAKKGATKAKLAANERARKAKPAAQKAAKMTGEAVEAGTFAVGKQLGRASGMFSAFKDEFQKASRGEDEY